MGNFSFIERAWPAIAECGRLAEQHVFTAPEASLIRVRQLLEALTAVLLGPERPRELYLAIDTLGTTLALPEVVLVQLHRARRLGNRAAHHEPGRQIDYGDALIALNVAHRALCELAARLIEPPPEPPTFREPERRLDPDELMRLLADKEQELAAYEARLAEVEARWREELEALRTSYRAELDRELGRRRLRLRRAHTRDSERRAAGQVGLFDELPGPEMCEALDAAPMLESVDEELETYRTRRLAEIERELAQARERFEREVDQSLPVFLRREPDRELAAPMAACTVSRGLPGTELAMTLWRQYRTWLEAGVMSDRMLVLLDSPTRTAWTGLLKGELPEHMVPGARPARPTAELAMARGETRVDTPISWMQAELARWWPLVEAGLQAAGMPATAPVARPLFVKVTLAQHLVERFSAEVRGEEGLLAKARTPRAMQNVHLLDALARTIEHGGSLLPGGPAGLAAEVARRLLEGGDPSPGARALVDEERQILERYLGGMLAHRVLDFALVQDLFCGLLWPHPTYREHLLATTSHVIFEHLDEAPPRLLALVRELGELGLTVHATLQQDDPEAPVAELFAGGLREYVGADPGGGRRLADRMRTVDEIYPERPFLELGRALHDALHGTHQPLVERPPGLELRLAHVTFNDMLEAVARELAPLVATVPPSELALVVPTLDPTLIWAVRRQVEALGSSLYVFAGTNRLMDYRPARLLLTMARLVYRSWELPPSSYELHELLEHVTGLDPLRLAPLISTLAPEGVPGDPAGLDANEAVVARYQRFHGWLARASAEPLEDFSLFFREAFARIYAPLALGVEAGAPGETLQREISQIGQLIEVAAEFQAVDRRLAPADEATRGRRFLEHLGGSPILERPFYKREPRSDAIMLGTANQLAEQGYRLPGEKLRHLFVLDVGSERWWKPDRKELVNPRVLALTWPGGRFGPEDARRTMDEKLARVLFTCCLKPTEGLHLHGALVDAEGREHLGELPGLLETLLPHGGPVA